MLHMPLKPLKRCVERASKGEKGRQGSVVPNFHQGATVLGLLGPQGPLERAIVGPRTRLERA